MLKFHTVVWVSTRVPAGQQIPLLLTDNGEILFEAWVFLQSPEARSRSSSWKDKAARFVGSFYDFFRAQQVAGLNPSNVDTLVADFIAALQFGTSDVSGNDPTGLNWKPWSSARISFAVSVIRRFCQSTEDVFNDDNQLSSSRFAQVTRTAFANEHRKLHSILMHLAFRGRSTQGRDWQSVKAGLSHAANVKTFPRSLLPTLLFEGCRRPRKADGQSQPFAQAYNVALMLALLLMVGTGLRKSELFHIFVDDVRPDEVRLYEPSMGRIAWHDARSGRTETATRREYLRTVYRRGPRNQLSKTDGEFAGWKSMLLDYGAPHYFAVTHWVDPVAKQLFFSLCKIYRESCLPPRMSHPYFFVSQSKKEYGRPWTINAFDQAFRTALFQIGKAPDATHGINPHGLRHLYGQTLTDMGLTPTVIQHCLHHRSIEAQLAYTKPSPQRIAEQLNAALESSSATGTSVLGLKHNSEYHWRSDPLKIFAPWALGGQDD